MLGPEGNPQRNNGSDSNIFPFPTTPVAGCRDGGAELAQGRADPALLFPRTVSGGDTPPLGRNS